MSAPNEPGFEVILPELHAFPLRAAVDEARAVLGDERLDALLSRYGITQRALNDPSGWLSLRFVEAFFADIDALADDRDWLERAMLRAMTPKYIGPLYPLIFAFGSPIATYRRLPEMAARVIKTGRYRCSAARPGFVRLHWVPASEQLRERTEWVCRARRAQLRLAPTIFGNPAATLVHPHCVARGDDECVYEISWTEPPSRREGPLGALAGLVLGAVWSLAGHLARPSSLLAVVVFGLCGWALGRLWSVRTELQARMREIAQHNIALDRAAQQHEQRFEELLEAKAEVERKVEQRTTELRETSLRLQTTLRELRALDRAKTDFFHNVSHELRTPLTLILGPLRDLQSGRVAAEDTPATLRSMVRNVDRLLRLINQTLDLAKIDAGAMRLERSSLDAVVLTQNVVRGFEAAAQRKQVELKVQAPSLPLTAAWDAAWIESALVNLVANALRHVSSGGHVCVSVEDRGLEVLLSVADDGEGMSEADAKRVFDRFAQGGDTHAGYGRTGLGLSIVRETARMHGGEVEVQSQPGMGAKFSMRLPRVYASDGAAAQPAPEACARSLPPASDAVLEDVTTQAQVDSAEEERAGPSERAPLALVVEDHTDLRRYIADVLASRYRVRTTGDGQSALALAQTLTPEVIVSDVAMPRLDGYGLCRQLRAHEATRHIPVVLVTAAGDLSRVLEGFDAGASDYVLKPFHARELSARVDVHVRVRQLVREVGRSERLAMLGTVAAAVAHQVRNPLTTLVSGLPVMTQRIGPIVDAASREMLQVMLDCALRIQQVTNDLLDLSRVDRAGFDELAPGSSLLAAVRLARARLDGGAVQLQVDVDDRTRLRARGGDLSQMFLNLVDNAIRAVGQRGTIAVRGASIDDFYVVTVEDSGSGIDPRLADKVFEPFWTTRPAGEGTGLGLSIAKQVIEEHAGTIKVGRSELGGARFELRLPLRQAPASNPVARESAIPRAS